MFGTTLKAMLELQNATPQKAAQKEFQPLVNIFTNTDKITIQAELPGMSKDEINIALDKQTLTVSGQRKLKQAEKNSTVHMQQKIFGQFSRSFKLPAQTDEQNISANYTNGILTITLPQVSDTKKVEINIK